MTTNEKLRTIIRNDIAAGLLTEVKNILFKNTPYVKVLNKHPEFLAQVLDELVEIQLPYYQTVSDAAVDKAFDFFTSDEGKEWFHLSGQYTLKLNKVVHEYLATLVPRLEKML